MSDLVYANLSKNSISTKFNIYYALTKAQLDEFNTWFSGATVDFTSLRFWSNPVEYINSIRVYPFNLINQPNNIAISDFNIYVGQIDSGISAKQMGIANARFRVCETRLYPKFNSFLDYSPYTKITLFLPYVGFVDLDASFCVGKLLRVDYVIDFTTGKCTAFVIIDNQLYNNYGGKIGIDIPIGATNNQELFRNLTLSTIKGVMGLTLGAGLAMGGIASGMSMPSQLIGSGKNMRMIDPADAAISKGLGALQLSAVSSFNSSLNDITSLRSSFSRNQASQDLAMWYTPQKPFIIWEYPDVQHINNYAHHYGKPLMQTRTIGNMKGFTVVDSVHIENIPATTEEINLINSILTNGFFAGGLIRTVTFQLTGMYSTNTSDAEYESPYTTYLKPNEGYVLNANTIQVFMDGVDITDTAVYEIKEDVITIFIPDVTGNIEIIGIAIEQVYEISGSKQWFSDITFKPIGTIAVNFTMDGVQYTQANFYTDNGNYIELKNVDGGYSYPYNNAWGSEQYRIWDFGDAQEVPKAFYDLVMNNSDEYVAPIGYTITFKGNLIYGERPYPCVDRIKLNSAPTNADDYDYTANFTNNVVDKQGNVVNTVILSGKYYRWAQMYETDTPDDDLNYTAADEREFTEDATITLYSYTALA